MVGWDHLFNGHGFEKPPGDSEGQDGLECYSPWGFKGLDTTELLNWVTENFPSLNKNAYLNIMKFYFLIYCCSVTKSYLTPCDPRIAVHRLSYSPLSPRICSDSCPLSWWCHPTISSSASPTSFCLQSFPTSGSLPMSQLFPSDGQGIGVSATVLPKNIQGWFPLGWTGWISLKSKGLSRVFSAPQFGSINSLALSFPHHPALTSIHD